MLLAETIKSSIRSFADFPKKGVVFHDISNMLKDKSMFKSIIDDFHLRYKDSSIDYIAGIEARGFIIGAALAYKLGIGFIPIRKKGKLPYKKESIRYELEYGEDTLELHHDALGAGEKVLLVDDQVVTGGTCLAAAELIGRLGGNLTGCAFVIEVDNKTRLEKFKEKGIEAYSLLRLDGN